MLLFVITLFQELEHFYLDQYNRKRCNKLLLDRGFKTTKKYEEKEEKKKERKIIPMSPRLERNAPNNFKNFKEEL
jgi:hypothetical protein